MTQSDTNGLEAVVLAAGRGVRFGGGKLLALLDDAPLVAHALRTALLSPVRRVFVAVADPAVRAAVETTARRLKASERLVVVPVESADEGMGASLRTAAAALPDDTTAVFVFLGDMPAIDPATPTLLARALKSPHDIVAPLHLGRRGHPVLFGATWLPALRTLSGDEGARALLENAGARLARIPVHDPGIHLDVDRPEDLARAIEGR
ncbi:NTP transferase domain-containing protein [Caulobacter sp. 602-1]|uniref:nucleotidyltransferase family protein n=1 Tax=Caulobacter sp. 602-1 TaxID=2492472 RepID=UPI000F6399A4|nr:nucleotidyltransferase family protein [Caulobacter sp. 602-1]RRN64842.1 nucleotidyltransferase family protein [Caulobacter sp. 602-1]